MRNKAKDIFTGNEGFKEFIKGNAAYVDKTGLIHDLFSKSSGPFSLSRPRRFGKTLLLDTIQHIAAGNRDLFAGLEISNRKYDWTPYAVIRLSMSVPDYTPAKFEEDLLDVIKVRAIRHGLTLDAKSPGTAINELITKVSVKHMEHMASRQKNDMGPESDPKNVVLLIDECDFPLNANIRDPKALASINDTLYKFYSSVKGGADMLRFTFLAGITEFLFRRMFSGLNDDTEISLNPAYSTICGFTVEEIRSVFKHHMEPTLKILKANTEMEPDATEDDLMAKLLFWYDGYSWDGATKVLNPYSVMSLFKTATFDDHWYNTGASRLTSRLEPDDIDYFSLFSENLSFESRYSVTDVHTPDTESLLMQAGYLTISNITGTGKNRTYHLKIPNNEIFDAARTELLARAVAPPNSAKPMKFINGMYIRLLESFASLDAAESQNLLGSIYSGVPQHSSKGEDEYFYRGLLQLLLGFGNNQSLPEDPSDIGRADLAVQTPKGDWIVMEIKHEKAADGGDRKSQQNKARVLKRLNVNINAAFSQILARNYGRKYLGGSAKVYAAAIAIHGTSDVMVRFARLSRDPTSLAYSLEDIARDPNTTRL
ncbi:MAG: ATP-binding protein [Deltaproteobacteria bacterium]|jgi:hypothetical protein|nr:ATP-binding protein [Deltaproteobacteria bacterium]